MGMDQEQGLEARKEGLGCVRDNSSDSGHSSMPKIFSFKLVAGYEDILLSEPVLLFYSQGLGPFLEMKFHVLPTWVFFFDILFHFIIFYYINI